MFLPEWARKDTEDTAKDTEKGTAKDTKKGTVKGTANRPVNRPVKDTEKGTVNRPVKNTEIDLKTDEVDVMIMSIMLNNNSISIPELSKKINKGVSATKARISKLKEMCLLERIGADKNGYWKVKN